MTRNMPPLAPCSGTEPGQRRLAGIQTTGRQYRNLSRPEFAVRAENSVAVPMLFATWSLLHRGGKPLLNRLVWVVLSGAAANVAFALWQKATGMGWVNGQWSINANALWPDLHSFGAFMAAALGLGCGLLWVRGRSLVAWLAVVAAAIGHRVLPTERVGGRELPRSGRSRGAQLAGARSPDVGQRLPA